MTADTKSDNNDAAPTLALSSTAYARIGAQIEELGYHVVSVILPTEPAADLAPDFSFFSSSSPAAATTTVAAHSAPLSHVDCLFVSADIFRYFFRADDQGRSEEEARWRLGREKLIPRVRQWLHLPCAGLNEWEDALTSKLPETLLSHGAGVFGPAMGEFLLAHMLSIVRKLPYHRQLQQACKWEKVNQETLAGKTVGILGCGGIGLYCGKYAKPFGMTVIGTRRTQGAKSAFVDEWFGADRASALEVIKRSDFVVCCLPLMEATRSFCDEEIFQAMKETAWFINVSRGGTVDQEALIDCLKSQKIAGAVLDVMEPEPLPPDHELWGLENCIITSHDSWYTETSFTRSFDLFVRNATSFIRGEELSCVVGDSAHAKTLNRTEVE